MAYYIYTEGDFDNVKVEGNYPSDLIEDLSKKYQTVIVLSTYSDTIKIPMFYTLNGLIESSGIEFYVREDLMDAFLSQDRYMQHAIELIQRIQRDNH